jgi:hypothetical protein
MYDISELLLVWTLRAGSLVRRGPWEIRAEINGITAIDVLLKRRMNIIQEH